MKSIMKNWAMLLGTLILAGGLSGCDGIGIWNVSKATGNINTELSKFLNAETDEQKAQGLKDLSMITQRKNMVFAGWDSVIGYMSMYVSDQERAAILNDYDRARDMLGLSLLIARTNFATYCEAVANCTAENYNALLDRGRFVKSSLELAKPGLTERIALFQARYPRYDLNTAAVFPLKELLFNDEKFYKFLTDDEAALEFVDLDNDNRDRFETRDRSLERLRPVDITIVPALGS